MAAFPMARPTARPIGIVAPPALRAPHKQVKCDTTVTEVSPNVCATTDNEEKRHDEPSPSWRFSDTPGRYEIRHAELLYSYDTLSKDLFGHWPDSSSFLCWSAAEPSRNVHIWTVLPLPPVADAVLDLANTSDFEVGSDCGSEWHENGVDPTLGVDSSKDDFYRIDEDSSEGGDPPLHARTFVVYDDDDDHFDLAADDWYNTPEEAGHHTAGYPSLGIAGGVDQTFNGMQHDDFSHTPRRAGLPEWRWKRWQYRSGRADLIVHVPDSPVPVKVDQNPVASNDTGDSAKAFHSLVASNVFGNHVAGDSAKAFHSLVASNVFGSLARIAG